MMRLYTNAETVQFMFDISPTVRGNRGIAAPVLLWKSGVRMLFGALHGPL
jgi:hypothetical protein